MATITDVLNHHPLNEHERYCVYRLCPDYGWLWGYNGSYDNPTDVASVYDMLTSYPETFGVWITKESGDGMLDVTIFRYERHGVR